MEAPATIAAPGRNCWRRAHADHLAFLIDGAAYFEALALALERARRQVLILGWDVHSRCRLRRNDGPDGPAAGEARGALPSELGPLLDALAQRRRGLRIHVLDWDYSIAVALGREMLPVVQLDWRTHRRVELALDAEHPVGACHHQKLVVVDDRIAFGGGLDLTLRRWDTPAHAPEDPRRVELDGAPYEPFHDVQMMVDGEAAAALGALARERWRRATGHRLRPPGRVATPWPREVAWDLEDATIAIARTEPPLDAPFERRAGVREVEALYLDAIAAARRWIYLENQYLTSPSVGEALGRRLREPDGPEVVVVGPRTCSGWLEEKTMGLLRLRLVTALREADVHGRLRILCPTAPELGDARINVHSKVAVIDDASARVGSANLSARSMGFDTECDLFLEADGREATRRAIAGLRDRLLAEHLGVQPEKVSAALAETGSLIATIEALGGGRPGASTRTLEPLDCGGGERLAALLPETLPVDPNEPIAAGTLLEKVVAEEALLRRPIARAVGGALLLLAVAFAWRVGLFAELVSPGFFPWALRALAADASTPWWIAAAFLASGALFLPFAPLVLASALALGPLGGALWSLAGALTAVVVVYALGRGPLRGRVERLTRSRFHRARRALRGRGVLAAAAFRVLPSTPFALANWLAGAQRTPFLAYVAGSALVLAPRVAALAALAPSVRRVLAEPTGLHAATFVGLATLYGVAEAVAARGVAAFARRPHG